MVGFFLFSGVRTTEMHRYQRVCCIPLFFFSWVILGEEHIASTCHRDFLSSDLAAIKSNSSNRLEDQQVLVNKSEKSSPQARSFVTHSDLTFYSTEADQTSDTESVSCDCLDWMVLLNDTRTSIALQREAHITFSESEVLWLRLNPLPAERCSTKRSRRVNEIVSRLQMLFVG